MERHKKFNFMRFENNEEKNKYFENAFKNRKSFTGTKQLTFLNFMMDRIGMQRTQD